MHADCQHAGSVGSRTGSSSPKVFSETLSAGFPTWSQDCFLRRHFLPASPAASEGGSALTGLRAEIPTCWEPLETFPPEPEPGIYREGWEHAATLNKRWDGQKAVPGAACYSWMSPSSSQVGGRCFVLLLLPHPSCFPAGLLVPPPRAGAPHGMAGRVPQELGLRFSFPNRHTVMAVGEFLGSCSAY